VAGGEGLRHVVAGGEGLRGRHSSGREERRSTAAAAARATVGAEGAQEGDGGRERRGRGRDG
jgi:hypothetical protein